MAKALIIIHMQNDFCDGGPMANIDSFKIIPTINRIRANYDLIIFVKYAHPSNHSSFKQFGGTHPTFCVDGTKGCELNQDVLVKSSDVVIEVGTLQKYDTTSAFYNADGIEKQSKLKFVLQINNIKELYFCGNSMDNFIFSSIMDAINFQFKCFVVRDAIGYYDKEKVDIKIKYLESMGVIIL
jgi:nicotinamidase/pyrazinamidase